MLQEDSDSRLARFSDQARLTLETVSPHQAAHLLAASGADDRLLALLRIRVAIERGVPAHRFIAIASQLFDDPDDDCRWQALIVVGESIGSDPEAVWQVVEKHGSSLDEDMRAGIATVLLEHLLESDFDRFYPRVAKRVLDGDARFADTLRTCWVSTPTSPERRRLEHLFAASERGVRRVE